MNGIDALKLLLSGGEATLQIYWWNAFLKQQLLYASHCVCAKNRKQCGGHLVYRIGQRSSHHPLFVYRTDHTDNVMEIVYSRGDAYAQTEVLRVYGLWNVQTHRPFGPDEFTSLEEVREFRLWLGEELEPEKFEDDELGSLYGIWRSGVAPDGLKIMHVHSVYPTLAPCGDCDACKGRKNRDVPGE